MNLQCIKQWRQFHAAGSKALVIIGAANCKFHEGFIAGVAFAPGNCLPIQREVVCFPFLQCQFGKKHKGTAFIRFCRVSTACTLPQNLWGRHRRGLTPLMMEHTPSHWDLLRLPKPNAKGAPLCTAHYTLSISVPVLTGIHKL